MRFGFLFALQPTVITRRARQAVGLFDSRYRIGADYSYLADLCRRFRANFLSIPMAIKHDRAADGTRLVESHLSTGSTRFEFERDLLCQFDELFGSPGDPEIAALRRARQLVVARAALGQGNRAEALRYSAEAKHGLWWLVRFTPTPAVAQRIYLGLQRAGALARKFLRGPSAWGDAARKVFGRTRSA